MSTQWRKIVGDFREHRLQIFLIGLVLALGTAGVVAALNARAILQREIAKSYRSALSADVVLWFDKVEPELLARVRSQSRVAAADARRVAFTRVEGKSGVLFPMQLTIVRDFASQQVGVLHLHQTAAWPPADGTILVEQSATSLIPSGDGVKLRVRTPEGGTVAVPFAGFVHDTTVAPSTQDRVIYAYITRGTASMLGQSAEMDQLLVRIKDRADMSDATQFADDLNDILKTSNQGPLRVDVLNNTHPHAALMSTMLRVLQAFATIAFICSAALAVYMVSLWMKREIRQVGIMKTIGARSHQLAWQYLALLCPLLVVANAVALPVGAWLGRRIVTYYEANLNIDVTQHSVPSSLLLYEIVITLGIPFLAMAVPTIRAARMTARDSIHDPGISAPSGRGFFTTRLIKIPGDRRSTFALRNTFRRPWRLAVTLVALSLGGALLLTADNTYQSLMDVVDRSLINRGYDIHVQLQRPVPATQLESAARRIPDVQIAEAWRSAGVTIAKSAASGAINEGQRFFVLGYPVNSELFKLPLEEGRMPLPAEENAVVINRRAQSTRTDLKLGSQMEVHFRQRTAKVRVVGVVEEIASRSPTIYASFPAFEFITRLGDVSSVLRVKTNGIQETVASALDQTLFDAHLTPSQVLTSAEFRTALDEHLAVVTQVMKWVALASALVGAISLAASVSLNVLERAREIGVIRALGATPRTVAAIFLAEGGAVALISALLSVATSIFFSRFLNETAGREMLQVPVPLHFSGVGLALLSSGVLFVMLGVWLPLRRVLRMSVRDAVAYE